MSNVLAANKYTVDLKSYSGDCAAMFVWISHANSLVTDLERFYPIKSLEFLDSQSNSMINNVVIDKYINIENL